MAGVAEKEWQDPSLERRVKDKRVFPVFNSRPHRMLRGVCFGTSLHKKKNCHVPLDPCPVGQLPCFLSSLTLSYELKMKASRAVHICVAATSRHELKCREGMKFIGYCWVHQHN